MGPSDFVKPNRSERTASVAEMNAELDAIAASLGIVWSGAEVAGTTGSVRTRYAKPGQACGRGVVRTLSQGQIGFIRHLMRTHDTSKLVRLPGSEDLENMSLAGARDLIDRLLDCPELPSVVLESNPRPATPAMRDYARKLLAGKVHNEGEVNADALSFMEARRIIETYKGAPWKPRETAPRVELESGIYLVDGTVYKVQKAVHGSGLMYAKRLTSVEPYVKTVRGVEVTVTHEFVFASGAVREIRPEQRMSLEQAKEFGALYGVCCQCGTLLTRESSIEAGIGPWCAGRL